MVITFHGIIVIMNTKNNNITGMETIATCGQSYKHFMLVNYDSRVIIWDIFQSGTTQES